MQKKSSSLVENWSRILEMKVCVLEQNGENERFLDLFLVIVIFSYDYGVIRNIYTQP